VAAAGFASIVSEVICLIGFQITYGIVYYLIGLVIACFMAGLGVGAHAMVGLMRNWGTRQLVGVQVGLAALPVLIVAVVARVVYAGPVAGVGMTIFGVLALCAGFAGGMQFPLAVKLHLGQGGRVSEGAGALYGADLLGSCAGAFLGSAIMIPLLGMLGAALASAAVVALSAVLLVSGLKKVL
jgi:predicted membrane-bound spermidine synthase